MKAKNSLGRGLSDLGLSELLSQVNTDTPTADSSLEQLPITALMPGKYQPRTHFDEMHLVELADSIKSQGIIQPIVVRRSGSRYEIIAGERRWRAANMAGLSTVPVVIRELNDEAAMSMALIENIQRENLNPLEEARAYKQLIDNYSLTHESLAELVGKKRSSVSNSIRLFQLEPKTQAMLEEGQIDKGHALAIINLPAKKQIALAKRIVKQKASVRQAERWATAKHSDTPLQNIPALTPKQKSTQKALCDYFKTAVTIKPKHITIHFESTEEYERIIRQLMDK